MAITLFGAATWSCSYDDDDLWKEIDGIKTQLAELNKEVSALQTLVDALRQSKTISDVTQTDTGYTITFNDNTSVSIADGKNGTNAPEVGIDLFEGGYYWTIGGKGNWLTDANGHKIPVAGKDGSKPEMAVDADGYWIVDGARIKDAAGNDVKATGSNGKDGDSFFKSVSDGDDAVTFTLTDGTEIVIPKTSVSSFCFVQPDDGRSYFVFDFGKKKTLTLNTTDVETADFMNIPEGWKASLNLAKNSVTVQAPAASDAAYSGGIITLIGIDKKGNTVFASADVCASVDYTDKDGTFVVCEGNMTSVNGMLVYYDKAGKEYREVFEQANGGTLFLDEIDCLSLEAQASLLQVLQTGQVTRLGGKYPKSVSFKLIVATTVNLLSAVQKKNFRADLYYRLNALAITIPPLRERKEDIFPIVNHFIAQESFTAGTAAVSLDEEAAAAFLQYHWPGNTREVESVIEELLHTAEGPVLHLSDLPTNLLSSYYAGKAKQSQDAKSELQDTLPSAPPADPASPYSRANLEESQRIVDTLKACGGNAKETTAALSMPLSTLYRKMNKYGINPKDYKKQRHPAD